MSFWFINATARSAWAAATSQQAQLEGLRDEWAGQMSVRYYSSADAHLATVTHATPIIDTTTTPYSLRLGAWVAESHVQDGTAAYAILAVPAGADILRADASLAGAISDPGGRVRVDIGTTLRIEATASLPAFDLPSWIPTTAWEWTDVPGTVWSDSVTDAGTGASGAPAVTAADPGTTKSYIGTWDYSGPCYSRARHELWMFGGGHAANTINILTRWNLNQDTPTVTMVCAPSTETVRNADIAGSYPAAQPYFSDGKPYSPHSYTNNMYRDDADQFVSFGIANIATGPGGGDMGGSAQGYGDIAACSRAGTWAAANTYADIPSGFGPDATFGPRILSRDGSVCYYWPDDGQALQKFTFATNEHAAVGGPTTPQPPSRCSLDSAGTSTLHAITDSSSGWAVETRNLSTGARQVVTVSGYSLPTGLQCFGVEWAESIGKYIVVYIGSGWTGSANDAAITSFIVCTLEMTSASTATAALVSVATGDGAPAVRSALCGMAFDPDYDCLLLVTSYSEPVKALKVS